MFHAIRSSRKGQSTVEWALILAFIAITTQVMTARTGTEIERLFRASAEAIGVERGANADGEIVSSRDDEGGIAASGRTARAQVATRMAKADLAH